MRSWACAPAGFASALASAPRLHIETPARRTAA